MDECQALVLSLLTERFTRRRPRSSNGDPVEHFGRPPAHTQSPSNSVTACVRAPASPLAQEPRSAERPMTNASLRTRGCGPW